MTTQKKTQTGLKTSELWLVIGCVLDHVARQSDLYELIKGHALTTAEQVREVAEQLHGIDPGADPTSVYTLAAVYVVGRVALKWKTER